MQINFIDVTKVSAAWAIATALVIFWIHLTRPAAIPRTVYSAFVIGVRLLFVYGVSYALLCICLRVPINVFLTFSSVILLLSSLARLDVAPPMQEFWGILWLTIIIPIYILKQLILGFPDHDELIPPPPTGSASNDMSHLIQATGSVTATLRPAGKVEVAGKAYSATTADGKYLDRGAAIRVSGVRNGTLIVTVVPPIEELPA
ncbi:MAG: hypothetical protein JWN70_6865 [Planctomycetaceae bacterium]|nr:hypothetical protein [Planctomycetaceae bacterium]